MDRLLRWIGCALAFGFAVSSASAQCGSQPVTSFAAPVQFVGAVNSSRIVVGRTSSLEVYSVATPSSPVLLSTLELPEPIRRLETSGNTLKVVTENQQGDATLRTYSLATNTPVLTRQRFAASDVDPDGAIEYIVDLAAGRLSIVDTSFGEFPLFVGEWNTQSWAGYQRVRVNVVGTRAFISLYNFADQRATLQIINITDPARPTWGGVQFTDTGLPPFGAVAVGGSHVYVCRGTQLKVFNIFNFPFVRPVWVLEDDAQSVTVSGSTLWVAAKYEGLKAYDVAFGGVAPPLLGVFNTPGECRSFGFGPAGAFTADFGGGFQVVNTANPAAMTQTAWMDKAVGDVRDIQTVDNGFTYVLDEVGIRVVNTTNPASPSIVRTVQIPQLTGVPEWQCRARVLRIGIGYLMITGCSGELWLYSIANPDNPALVSYRSGMGTDYDLVQVGSTIFGAGQGGIRVINVTSPAAPTLAATYTPGALIVDVEAANGLLYARTRYSGLWILEDNVPTALQLLGYFSSPNLGDERGLRLVGQTGYVGSAGAGVLAVDVDPPTAPTVLGTAECDPNDVDPLDVQGGMLLGHESGGFRLWDVSVPGEFVRIGEIDLPSSTFIGAAEINGTSVVVSRRESGTLDGSSAPREYGLELYTRPTQWKADEVEHAQGGVFCPGGVVELQTRWRGNAGAIAYRWMKDGSPIAAGGRFLGVDTERLVITGAQLADVGDYVCIATNACGSREGVPASVVVCVGDFDCSGGVDGDDVIAFFGAWDAGLIGADVTGDGSVDSDDVIVFFAGWDAGC